MTRTWIVGIDFSDISTVALARAAETLAGLGGGRLVAVHVHVPASDGFGLDLAAVGPTWGDIDRRYAAEADERLRAQVARVFASTGGQPFPNLVIERRVIDGHPAEALTELATAEHADMIVLGSHGRRGLQRFFLGSVAEKALRLADGPVMVVKPERGTATS